MANHAMLEKKGFIARTWNVAKPLPSIDDDTLEQPWAVQKTKSKWEFKGGPKAKEGRASIVSKYKEEEGKKEKRKKGKKNGEKEERKRRKEKQRKENKQEDRRKQRKNKK